MPCLFLHCKGVQAHCRSISGYHGQGVDGNMRKHVWSCWGTDILDMADNGENLENARKIVKAYRSNSTITLMFERQKGKGAVTYSH